MDGFEKHIRNQHSALEEHKADKDKMWKHIQAGLDENKSSSQMNAPRLRTNHWWKIAASIVVVVGILATIFLFIPRESEHPVSQLELLEIDLYYENLVAKQVKLVNSNPNISTEEKEEFLAFMSDLDEEYDLLTSALEDGFNDEKVLAAIVTHYQKRIEIIESLLNRINAFKNDRHDEGILL